MFPAASPEGPDAVGAQVGSGATLDEGGGLQALVRRRTRHRPPLSNRDRDPGQAKVKSAVRAFQSTAEKALTIQAMDEADLSTRFRGRPRHHDGRS
ncbi:unnamed protein product [Discosporangium mesarthrocarpum]